MLNLKKLFLFVLIILMFFGVLIARNNLNNNASPKDNISAKVTLVLDWTPNTNHTGIYVAKSKGYFKDLGLDVEILPFTPNASPDVLVSTGKADIGISSTEWVVGDAALGSPVKSIAAIIQPNTSALITLSDSGLKRPKDLVNKKYGGFGAPFESAVVGQIIKKDGGKPEIKNITIDVGAMKALESKRIDFVWAYQGWEVIEARRAGFKVNIIPITEYGIPDYYSPTFITSQKTIDKKKETLIKFMKALSLGYEFARKNPKESATILIQSVPSGTFPDEGLVYESQDYLSPKYADKGRSWGLQDSKNWHDFPRMLLDSGSITDQNGKTVKEIDLESLYTNELLPK